MEEFRDTVFDLDGLMVKVRKSSHVSADVGGVLAKLALMPPGIAKTLARYFSNKASGVLTNVPGPRAPLYFAGDHPGRNARRETAHINPFGQISAGYGRHCHGHIRRWQGPFNIMRVKPGCIITDVARPLDLYPEDVAKRPDVLVIESGEDEDIDRVRRLALKARETWTPPRFSDVA